MAALPYMKLFPADYLADTQHLTTEEHGAYLLLLMNYWQSGKPLDNRNGQLAKVVKLSSKRWNAIEPTLKKFFTVKRGIWKHERVDFDIQFVLAKSTKASKSGTKSAQKRANSRSTKPVNDDLGEKDPKSPSTLCNPKDAQTPDSDPLSSNSGAKRVSERSTNVQRTLNHTDTDTDTDKRLNTLESSTKIEKINSSFEEFWQLYPKQPKGVGPKKSARAEYMKIVKTVDSVILLEGLKRFITTKPDVGYIPYVVTWLKGERWNDEVASDGIRALYAAQLTHAKTTDPKTGEEYCQNCGSAWPCITESKKGGNLF